MDALGVGVVAHVGATHGAAIGTVVLMGRRLAFGYTASQRTGANSRRPAIEWRAWTCPGSGDTGLLWKIAVVPVIDLKLTAPRVVGVRRRLGTAW